MKKILLIGGGGHCRSVIDVIEQEGKYKIAGIVDRLDKVGSTVLGNIVIGDDGDLIKLRQDYDTAIITIGFIKDISPRLSLYLTLKKLNFKLPVIISPRAYVSQYAKIGEGSVVMHDSVVNTGAIIGVNCILNTKSLIEHDVVVGDHCHVSTGAIVNGESQVQSHSFIGSNAVVVHQTIVQGFNKAGSLLK